MINTEENKSTESYISDFFNIFHDSATPKYGGEGWGQFLDGKQGQVGRYGTSAGVIVQSIAGRCEDSKCAQSLVLIDNWLNGTDVEDQDHLSSILVHSILAYAKGTASNNYDEKKGLIEALLEKRITSTKTWGCYWKNSIEYDARESVFVSSIALIALFLIDDEKSLQSEIKESAIRVRGAYKEDPDHHAEYAPVVFAMLAIVLPEGLTGSIKQEMDKYALKPIDLRKHYTFFYDYVASTGERERDYFIVPPEIFTPLALSCADLLPVIYRIKARNVISELKEILNKNNGKYVSSSSQRVSTLDQMFAALALRYYIDGEEKGEKGFFSLTQIFYHLWRERGHKRSFNTFVIFAYITLVLTIGFAAYSGINLTGMEGFGIVVVTFLLAHIKNPIAVMDAALRGK